MIRKTKSKKIPRRLLAATMSCVFMISLSSCSGAGNSYGKLNADEVYAKSGNYTVTNGELWNELKWDAASIIEEQIKNVVINDQIEEVKVVMANDYDSLTAEQKEDLGSNEEYTKLYDKYSARLVDYVVQDVFNFNYNTETYWKALEDLDSKTKKINIAKYADEIYSSYKIDSIESVKLVDLLNNANEENQENYLTIATTLNNVYYPLLAKEIFAESKTYEKIEEAMEESSDDEEKIGYFSNSEYISQFKKEYANQHDLSLLLIRFNTEDEFNDTLRAFGIKIYNKQYYYVDGVDPETGLERSYNDYCEYYDELSNSELSSPIDSGYMLEIFIQIYNYIYGGYKDKLTSGSNLTDVDQLNLLRTEITNKLLNMPADEVKEKALNALKDNEELVYSRERIDEISSSFYSYLYETLDLEKVCFSTSTQSHNESFYIAYKFDEAEPVNTLYNKDLTDDQIIEIITDEENKEIFDTLQKALVDSTLTDSTISNYLKEATDDVKVQIYDEATEIKYALSHTNYSKTISKNKNKNVLATIEFDGKKWNLNITADNEDEKSVKKADGQAFGIFDYLEGVNGQTTAIDILSKKLIKDTDAYAQTNEDRDLYKDYIEAILYNFANEGYASSGYSSTIGKYNFLMLYFHSTNIDEIIDNYYRVQFASTKILVDHSNDKLISFIKSYSDSLYEKYFSLSATRLVVYFDGDDDNQPDEIADWKDKVVSFDGNSVTLEEVSKSLVFDVYTEISSSTEDHSTKLTSVVEEYNDSARVAFDNNPIVSENKWAKYKKLGLRVKTEDVTATNSTLDMDFNLKQRLFDYTDPNGEYQYFINNTTPSIYIEPIYEADIAKNDDTIVETKDGYNLILVTTGNSKPSAEWSKEDFDTDLYNDITIKYNEKYVTIDDIFNDEEKLTANQIKLYFLEYVLTGSSTLLPSDLASACSTFLTPVITRFTSDATQRQIVMEYINNTAGEITWTNENYSEVLDNIIMINQKIADSYTDLYEDTTGTSNSFENWWDNLSTYLKEAK